MQDATTTDEQLIARIKQSDKAAFRLLFDRHYKILLATAINILKDVNTAKDVTQEVFLQLWKKRDTLNIQTNPPAYLKRAVINRAFNHIKARKRIVNEEFIADTPNKEPAAQAHLEAADLETAMKKAMDTLPEKCRLVFVMRRLEGLSLKEIAEKLDISPKTVENQITKALKVLKTAIQPFMDEQDKYLWLFLFLDLFS